MYNSQQFDAKTKKPKNAFGIPKANWGTATQPKMPLSTSPEQRTDLYYKKEASANPIFDTSPKPPTNLSPQVGVKPNLDQLYNLPKPTEQPLSDLDSGLNYPMSPKAALAADQAFIADKNLRSQYLNPPSPDSPTTDADGKPRPPIDYLIREGAPAAKDAEAAFQQQVGIPTEQAAPQRNAMTPEQRDLLKQREAAKARYLSANGPSMGQQTDRLNAQADSMSGANDRAQQFIEGKRDTTPYGARYAGTPYGQQDVNNWNSMPKGPTQEELLADNKSDMDTMNAMEAKNNAAMQSRDNYKIKDPEQMRKDLKQTTDAYRFYKLKGGEMDFRGWAAAADSNDQIEGEARTQLANNYPGIFDNKVDPNGTDINSVAGNPMRNTTRDKLVSRREALLKLQDSPSARIADAVAHGQNPNAAWAAYNNQQAMATQQGKMMDFYKTAQEAEQKNKIDVARAGRDTPDEIAAAEIRAKRNSAQEAYAQGMAQGAFPNQSTRDAFRKQIEQIYGVSLDTPREGQSMPADSPAGAPAGNVTAPATDWKSTLQQHGPLTNDVAGWTKFSDSIGGDPKNIKEAAEYAGFDITPEKARGIYDQIKEEAEQYANEAYSKNWWNAAPGSGEGSTAKRSEDHERLYSEYMADKAKLIAILKHLLPSEPDLGRSGKYDHLKPSQASPTQPATPYTPGTRG